MQNYVILKFTIAIKYSNIYFVIATLAWQSHEK